MARLAWPIVVFQLLQVTYDLADTLWLGRLSADAVGAISRLPAGVPADRGRERLHHRRLGARRPVHRRRGRALGGAALGHVVGAVLAGGWFLQGTWKESVTDSRCSVVAADN